jgi:hypothetical protein
MNHSHKEPMNPIVMQTNRRSIRQTILTIIFVLLHTCTPAWSADPLDHWTLSASQFPISQVAFGNGVFVGMSPHVPEGVRGGIVATSSNSLDWARQLPPVSLDSIQQLAFLRGTFFVTVPFMTSSNGVNWTNHVGLHPRRLAYGNNAFVGIDSGVILVSSNGLDWVTNSASPYFRPTSISFGNGVFVIAGMLDVGFPNGDGIILSSPDGRGWTFRRQIYEEQPFSVVFGNGRFLVSGDFGSSTTGVWTNLLTSMDGLDWNPRVGPRALSGLSFDYGVFLASANIGEFSPVTIVSSFDGVVWRQHEVGSNYIGSDGFAFGNGTFVGVGWSQIVQSSPLTNGLPSLPAELAVNTYAGLSVTGSVGRVYSIEVSTNLGATNSWQPLTNITLTTNPQLWIDPQPASGQKRFYRAVLR